MKSKKILALSKEFIVPKYSDDFIFFGKFSKFFLNENFSDTKSKINFHNNCSKSYEILINDIGKSLNKIHNVNFSSRSWNIILGSWLRVFILAVYENFFILEKTIKEINFDQIISYDPDEYNLFTNNGYGLELAIVNAEWNCALSSKIIKFLGENSNKIVFNKCTNTHFKNQETRPTTAKNPLFFFVHLFKKFFCLLKKNNYACIFNSYLPFLYEKKLEIQLGQVPQSWNFEKEIKFKKFNPNLRGKLDFKTSISSNKFEEFLRSILPNSLPVSVIESFTDINKLSDNSDFPKKPKFIFTSDAFCYHEIFKFYTAKKTQEGVPYYLGQHGNSYFTHVYNNFTTEMNICDKFISWGFNDNKKATPTFNFKVLGKKKLFNSKGKFLIIFGPLHTNGLPVLDLAAQEKKNFEYSVEFVKNLSPEIRNETIGRPSWSKQYSLEKPYFEKLKNSNIKMDYGNQPLKNLLKKTRLTFFNYDSTGILEHLALNIPTVCHWNNTFGSINSKFLELYEMLIKAKILFKETDSLIKHVETNWNNIDDWWMDQSTQVLIKKFNSQINISPDNTSLINLKNLLLKN